MHHRTKLFLGCLVCLFLVVAGCDQTALDTSHEEDDLSLRNGEVIPGQYIVVLDQTSLGKKAAATIGEITALAGVDAEFTYQNTLSGFAGRLSETALADLRNDPRVAYIEEDRMIVLDVCDRNPSHPKCDDGGGDDGGGGDPQETPYGITRVGGAGNGTGQRVCVIDTGVDLDHPDLNVDASSGFNAFTRGRDGRDLDDGNGHGTHVSGTIAAIDNTIGVVGVAAGATVVPIKVLSSSGSGSTSGVIAGVDHAGTGVCSVANMSLGGGTSTALDDAVESASANVQFSLAAGNSGDDANNYSPARVNGSNIYTISAIDSNDQFASFSNYGNPPVDYAAPGVGVLSTYRNGGYATLSGTSMAAPHVAGILLLGNINSDGNAQNDPDGNADPIAHR